MKTLNTQETNYVLVVVDMQSGFRASLKAETIAAVQEEIRAAKELQRPVVILEYAKYPATHECLTALLEGYEHLAIETKLNDDGSVEVIEACLHGGFGGSAFRVCGVNTNACVKETALGLAEKLDESQVSVIKAACNDELDRSAWSKFPRRKNLKLV